MLAAMEDYFPESGFQQVDGVTTEAPLGESSSTEVSQPYNLRRAHTGLSSIVGANNGDRPGGFVLVIDGNALEYVSSVLSFAEELFNYPLHRH